MGELERSRKDSDGRKESDQIYTPPCRTAFRTRHKKAGGNLKWNPLGEGDQRGSKRRTFLF